MKDRNIKRKQKEIRRSTIERPSRLASRKLEEKFLSFENLKPSKYHNLELLS